PPYRTPQDRPVRMCYLPHHDGRPQSAAPHRVAIYWRGASMPTPEECRKTAEAYYRLALEAKTEADRLALLQPSEPLPGGSLLAVVSPAISAMTLSPKSMPAVTPPRGRSAY